MPARARADGKERKKRMAGEVRDFDSFCRALLEDGLSLGSGDGKRFHTVIPGTWESPADGSPVRWHTGDPETDPWEWRMRVLEERDDIAYAKLFFRTSGYIAWPLYPLFYAVRRRGESLEEAYRRGTVSGAAKRIYDVLAASGGVPLHDLKLLGRFSKGEKSAFDRALTDLQSRMFITVCGREQKRDKNGRAYGWSSTVFTTVEDFWAVRGRSLGKEDPERAYAVLLARLRTAIRHTRTTSGNASIAKENRFTARGLVIDYDKYRVYIDGRDAGLTQNEFKLVALLGRFAGRVLTYDYLIREIWGPNKAYDNQILRVNMANIRRKIEKNPAEPEYIFTEVGVGYRMIEGD